MSEVVRLKVASIDSRRMLIHIENGKGGRDRYAMLSPRAGTPLRIPYGNKDVAMKLGARYGSAGWYAPPGVDLSAFGERGWL